MTDLEERSEVPDLAEWVVCNDLADVFLLGVRGPPALGDDSPEGSLFWSKILLLGEN